MNKEFINELKTQDNAYTHEPIYVVYEKIRYTGNKEYDCEGHSWHYNGDWSCETDKELIDEIKEDNPDFDESLINDCDDEFEFNGEVYTKWYYQIIPRYVQPFFTRKAAEAYIEQNSHNLTNPYVYVHSLYRNYEMINIRKHFMEKEQ